MKVPRQYNIDSSALSDCYPAEKCKEEFERLLFQIYKMQKNKLEKKKKDNEEIGRVPFKWG